MKTYIGRRQGSAVDVTVDGKPLNPRLDLWNHSPTGFEWGYGGSGPAQLSLALLTDCLGDNVEAVLFHQDFKQTVVAGLPYQGWTLTDKKIKETLEVLQSD